MNTNSYIRIKVGNLFRKKQNKKVHISIEQRCSDIFSRHYKETVSVKGTSWSANLEYSDVYNDYVRKTVKYVQSTLQQIWKELKLKDNDLLENITPVPSNLTGSISKDVRLNSNLIQNLDTAMAAKFSALSFVKGMAFFTATTLALMPIVAIPIIGQLLGFIIGIMAWIKYLNSFTLISTLKIASTFRRSGRSEKHTVNMGTMLPLRYNADFDGRNFSR